MQGILGLVLLACLPLSPGAGSSRPPDDETSTTITKEKPSIREELLDPAHPPDSIRNELGKHHAYTNCNYALRWSARSTLKSQKKVGQEIEASVVIDRMDATLRMSVTLYLPKDVSSKLRAHEAGHQKIGETVYEGADREAFRIVQSKVGRTYTGQGATLELAEQAARKLARDEVLAEYKKAVRDAGQQVQERYDELTNHGSKSDVTEADAIREAFKTLKPAAPSRKK